MKNKLMFSRLEKYLLAFSSFYSTQKFFKQKNVVKNELENYFKINVNSAIIRSVLYYVLSGYEFLS